jgi:hypothetical protein
MELAEQEAEVRLVILVIQDPQIQVVAVVDVMVLGMLLVMVVPVDQEYSSYHTIHHKKQPVEPSPHQVEKQFTRLPHQVHLQ